MFPHGFGRFVVSVGEGFVRHEGLHTAPGQLLLEFLADERLIRILDVILGSVLNTNELAFPEDLLPEVEPLASLAERRKGRAHARSARQEKVLVVVNAVATPAEQLCNELWVHGSTRNY